MPDTRLPFQRHLKWLIIEGVSFEAAADLYDNIQLPKPSLEHFKALQDDVETLPLSPATKRRLEKKIYHENDLFVLKKLGFEEIYLQRTKKSDWSEVLKIINSPIMRVAIDCCLVANVPDEEICQLVVAAHNFQLSESTINVYKRYFLDVDVMRKNDWQAYLNLLADDKYTYSRIFTALTKSRDEVLHLIGLPTKAQFGTMLKNVMSTSHYRFEYFARQNSPEAQDQARKWAKVLMEAGAKHDKFGATDATDFSQLVQTEFVHIDGTIETVSPEMLADAKPKVDEKGTQIEAPIIPDLGQITRPANDI